MSASPTNLRSLADDVRSVHEHIAVADVNDHRLTLAVNEKPYPWHRHPDSDELFLIVEGSLRIEFTDRTPVALGPMDTWLVPAGVVHRTVPQGRCVNVVFETAGTETVFLEQKPVPPPAEIA